jgi:biopolymer transport protein ExbD
MAMALKTLSGSASEDTEHDGAIMAEINITPLTDIFLVLLIIFMVTSSVMSQQGVDVNLPAASAQTSQNQPDGVIVTLLPGGELRVNSQKISGLDQVESALRQVFEKTKSRLVILEGDRQAFLGSAIEVMDRARKAGAAQFAIATQPEK